jgi:acetoacetyl-CoA reductase
MSKRVALVTGGTGGLGTAICIELANADRLVIASDVTAGTDAGDEWLEEMRASGHDIHLVHMDVTDEDSCTQSVASLEAAYGPVDILINCAGITRDGTFRKMDLAQWRAVLSTNLDSVFTVTRPLINGMLEREFGRIVNISSLNGEKGQFGQANYSAAKAGMHGFTMALAQEVASKGITVNTVSPGYIGTKMVMAVPEEVRNQIIAQIPVGRLGTPEDIAQTVAFLTRDEASFITGANFSINGGQHMH